MMLSWEGRRRSAAIIRSTDLGFHPEVSIEGVVYHLDDALMKETTILRRHCYLLVLITTLFLGTHPINVIGITNQSKGILSPIHKTYH
jgi:hypothetical protein